MLATLTQDTISSQGCQLLRHFEFGAEDSVRSLSRETNELPKKVQRVSSQDVNIQRRTDLPPIPVTTAGNERGTNRQLRGGREKGGGGNYRMNFRPRADMGLDVEATRLIVYIYAFVRDPRYVLFVLLHFRSPALGSIPQFHTDITWKRRTNATCWFLPSTFAADILRGIVWDDVHHIYQYFWMPETTALQHVINPFAIHK
ncbi:hypothetical protein PIB30_104259 [Stylosanthes scabra]|uniref:Uncharacterized protein n=1 Tax=Stylosanthes scabra TaxID=79078 RepID=A0ABU6SYX6_9FABA|nr:hypothetical protein [Stylosanthes scabra]